MLIESRPSLEPELAALVVAQQRELRESRPASAAPAPFPVDDAAYLVAVIGGRAVGCGAWRPLVEDAELCRMYVRPAFRGRGIARQLIVAIEEEALAMGRPVIRLAAGTAAAIALFQSSGYHQIPLFGAHSPASVCFEKRLGALVQ